MTLRSLAPCLRAAREKHRFAAGKKHRNGKKHVWQQEKNALQREQAVSAAGKNASKKCRFAAGKIQSSRKNTLQQHKSTFAAEKMHFGGSGKKPSEAGKNPSEARKKPAEAGKKPATEKVQLCNPKSCRNGKNTFPQREKAAAPSRIVKFLAAAWKTASRVSIRPRNHSSAAIVINNFACSHKAGSTPRLSGWKKIFSCG